MGLMALLAKGGVKTKADLRVLQDVANQFGVDPRNIVDMFKRQGSTINWAPASTVKLRVPLTEHEFGIAPSANPLGDARKIELDELQGGILIPFPGDRAGTGFDLKSVNDETLPWDVEMQGGARFPQAVENQKQGSVWASQDGAATIYQNKVDALAKKYPGVKQYGIYWTMGGTSGDYNVMTADTLLGMLQQSKLTKKTVKEMDAALKKKSKGKWTGINDEKARGLLRTSGDLRKLLIDLVDGAEMQGVKGMPDIGAIRHATMDPSVVMAPNGTTGLSVSELIPGATTNLSPDVAHNTYNSHLRGKYLGELRTQLPSAAAFPDFEAQYGHYPSSNKEYTLRRQLPSQLMDDKWRDNVEALLKQRRK